MGKIKQLPQYEIHKIAAGEVVERPANVIKELVENSLDAGALSITVYAEHGGKALMRVVDDGIGMSPEDARMSLVHHATSKLSTIDDLEHISTFGFRGEALSSISAVSRMQLITRERIASEGIKLTITEGTIVQEEVVACTTGTDITITDLFYTVPARKKFLKADDTEWRNLYQLMQAFALSYPACAFTLYHNNKIVLQCRPANSLAMRMQELYDATVTSSLLVCESVASPGFSIEGQITNPHVMRYDRSQIYLFVNKRWIKNSKLTHAVLKGYNNVLLPGRYPAAVLCITIDSSQVDINIHPRKEEVHFLHPRRVESAVESLVRERLERYTKDLTSAKSPVQSQVYHPAQSIPGYLKPPSLLSTVLEHESENLGREIPSQFVQTLSAQTVSAQESFSRVLDSVFAQSNDNQMQGVLPIDLRNERALVGAPEVESYRLIGQLLQTYILIENDEGMVLIDQHAAHERILYELFANRFEEVAVVPLLFPAMVTLHEHEAQLLEKHAQLFAHYGIVVQRISLQQCAVQSAPVMLKNVSYEDILRHMITIIQEEQDAEVLENTLHHALRAQMACKAAVKAGDTLTYEHMRELITSLNKTPNRFSCPHGRPTSWPITSYEIERKFKRKV
jgi:DNA mismatch repair protein MutL